ncbi:MAG: hypothetical protein SA339_06770 [Methanomassiliicoccus sp.]|nr:hypothetical protein [Methanomassiliicoccus sp.]
MDCSKCGTTNDESATVCQKCNASLNAPEQPAKKRMFSNTQVIIVAAVVVFAVFIVAASI